MKELRLANAKLRGETQNQDEEKEALAAMIVQEQARKTTPEKARQSHVIR